MSNEARPQHPDPETWWKHLRRLAYAAMLGLFAVLALLFLAPDDQVTAAVPVLQSLVWAFAAIVASYIGGSVWDHIGSLK